MQTIGPIGAHVFLDHFQTVRLMLHSVSFPNLFAPVRDSEVKVGSAVAFLEDKAALCERIHRVSGKEKEIPPRHLNSAVIESVCEQLAMPMIPRGK